MNKYWNFINRIFFNNIKISREKFDIIEYFDRNEEINILEAGSCDGFDTVQLAKLFPNSAIYAFEPVSKNFKLLKKTVKKYRNIKLFNLALSDKNGEALINLSKKAGFSITADSSSILKPKEHLNVHKNILFNDKEKISTITLDEWAKANNINQIDFMWLDMQGLEPVVLKSSPKILKTVKAIYTEVSHTQMYENTLLYPEFKKWLEEQGFNVAKEYFYWQDMGNVLFIRQ